MKPKTMQDAILDNPNMTQRRTRATQKGGSRNMVIPARAARCLQHRGFERAGRRSRIETLAAIRSSKVRGVFRACWTALED
jgi:hypothetical protein